MCTKKPKLTMIMTWAAAVKTCHLDGTTRFWHEDNIDQVQCRHYKHQRKANWV